MLSFREVIIITRDELLEIATSKSQILNNKNNCSDSMLRLFEGSPLPSERGIRSKIIITRDKLLELPIKIIAVTL